MAKLVDVGVVTLTNQGDLESLRLAQLRDALLPKLIPGEIDVSKIGLTHLA